MTRKVGLGVSLLPQAPLHTTDERFLEGKRMPQVEQKTQPRPAAWAVYAPSAPRTAQPATRPTDDEIIAMAAWVAESEYGALACEADAADHHIFH